MKVPEEKHKSFIRGIIKKSVKSLIRNDLDLFFLDREIYNDRLISDAHVYERELNEITINHRLAYYLERYIKTTSYKYLKIDIEYNRYYLNRKIVNINEESFSIRPDIILHTRAHNNTSKIQHFLAIETKKGDISDHDIAKIKGLISDDNYEYLFGLTVSYMSDINDVICNLYYYDGIDITNEEIRISKS